MENCNIQYLRKFLSWCSALESLLTVLYFRRLILFMIRQPYTFLTLRGLLDAAFSLVTAAVLGVAWWVVWKGKPSARNWGIAASFTFILIFLKSIAFPAGSIWGHLGVLVVGTIGMVLFLRRDQQHDPRLPTKARPATTSITLAAGIASLVGLLALSFLTRTISRSGVRLSRSCGCWQPSGPLVLASASLRSAKAAKSQVQFAS